MSSFKTDIYEADIKIEIDRLVFRGMDLSQERAERIRGRVEEELQRLMEQEGNKDGFLGQEMPQEGSQEVSQIEGTGFQIGTVSDDARFARELAAYIFKSIEEIT